MIIRVGGSSSGCSFCEFGCVQQTKCRSFSLPRVAYELMLVCFQICRARSSFLSVDSFFKRIGLDCVKMLSYQIGSRFRNTNFNKFDDMVTMFRHLKIKNWDGLVKTICCVDPNRQSSIQCLEDPKYGDPSGYRKPKVKKINPLRNPLFSLLLGS